MKTIYNHDSPYNQTLFSHIRATTQALSLQRGSDLIFSIMITAKKPRRSANKTDKLFSFICNRLAISACGPAVICASLTRKDGTSQMTYSAFKSFIDSRSPHYDQQKADRFDQALEHQKFFLVETVLNLSEQLHLNATQGDASPVIVQALKLRIDAIKWYLAKFDADATDFTETRNAVADNTSGPLRQTEK